MYFRVRRHFDLKMGDFMEIDIALDDYGDDEGDNFLTPLKYDESDEEAQFLLKLIEILSKSPVEEKEWPLLYQDVLSFYKENYNMLTSFCTSQEIDIIERYYGICVARYPFEEIDTYLDKPPKYSEQKKDRIIKRAKTILHYKTMGLDGHIEECINKILTGLNSVHSGYIGLISENSFYEKFVKILEPLSEIEQNSIKLYLSFEREGFPCSYKNTSPQFYSTVEAALRKLWKSLQRDKEHKKLLYHLLKARQTFERPLGF